MFLSRRCIHTTPLFTSMAGCISPSSRAHANFLASSVRGIPPTIAPLERELERSKAAIAPRKTHRAARAGCIMPIDAVTWSQRVERSRVRTVHDAEALRTYLLSSAAGAVAGGLLALTILRWHGLLRKSKTIAGAKDARYSRTFIVTTSVCCGLLLAGNYARLVSHPPHAEQAGSLVQGRTSTVECQQSAER